MAAGAATLRPALAEYCERGSLTQVLQQASSDAAAARELTWPRRLALALGVAKGLLYLHTRSPPILHRVRGHGGGGP